jgi:NTE family protein
VLLLADAGDTPWTRLALRHADLVLLVADASGAAGLRDWEPSLLGRPDWPVAARALLLLHDGCPVRLAGTARWLAGRDLAWHLHLRAGSGTTCRRASRACWQARPSASCSAAAPLAASRTSASTARCARRASRSTGWAAPASARSWACRSRRVFRRRKASRLARHAFVAGKPFSDYTLPVVSLLRGGRLDRLLARHVEGDIEDLPLPFFCVSSNLGQGTLQVHSRGPLAAALRAGVALPGVFPPAVVNGQLSIDGGILDNLPVDVMRRQPVGRVIAVDVTSRQTYEVDYPAVPSPWAVLAGRLLPFARRHRVPSFMSLMLKATEVGTMAEVRAAGEARGPAASPPGAAVRLHRRPRLRQVVEAGYLHARESLAQWPHST